MEEIAMKARLLAAFETQLFPCLFHELWGKNKYEGQDGREFSSQELCDCILAIGASIGIDLESFLVPRVKRLSLDLKQASVGPIRLLFHFVYDSSIADTIGEFYGERIKFNFSVPFYVCTILSVSSLLAPRVASEGVDVLPKIVDEDDENADENVENDVVVGQMMVQSVALYLEEHIGFVQKFIGEDAGKICSELIELSAFASKDGSHYEKISSVAERLVDIFIPDYFEMSDRLSRAKALRQELKLCKPGWKNWQEYEDICLKALKFLFVPPFKWVTAQARSQDNHERRDAALSNNLYEGFWNQLRQEFGCRHIICEFKNGGKTDKDSLNQLRVYLSKRTIGRFGMLFIRRKPSKSLIQAQKYAYEQQGIYIMLIDDEKLAAMISWRAYLGTLDEFLEREKIKFEIEY